MKDETVTIPKNEYGKLLEIARLVEVLVAENARLAAENKLLRDNVSFVKAEPVPANEEAACRDARDGCPVSAITLQE